MDERELHELLRGAAENVQPSPDLPDRAERRYYRRSVRGRVLAAAVVVVIVGAGISVAATIGGEHPGVARRRPQPPHPAIDVAKSVR